MPSATTASFDEHFISDRLLNFMHNSNFNVGSNNRTSFTGQNALGHPASTQKTFALDKDGGLATMSSMKSNPVTCNSPVHPPMINGYPAMASPSLIHKYSNGLINSAFTTPNPGNKVLDDYHSLQSSPNFNHYSSNCAFKRQPGDASMNPNVIDYSQSMLPRRAPQRELFPQISMQHCENPWSPMPLGSSNNQAPALHSEDRRYYTILAQNRGFIVGEDLEKIKENSRRSTSHTYGRISAHFRNRYGETEAKTKASYMQLGVRVPSKDHVSEIVGKGGEIIFYDNSLFMNNTSCFMIIFFEFFINNNSLLYR